MPVDALMQLQASVTKTATFSGTSPAGINFATEPGGVLVCRVIYSAGQSTGGTGTALFQVDTSQDNSTWSVAGGGGGPSTVTLLAPAAAAAGELSIPFEARNIPGSVLYARLTVTITGTAPTITYQGDIAPSFP